MSKVDTNIDEIVEELWKLFEQHKDNNTLNEYVLETRPLIKLSVDLSGTADYCYRMLKEIVKRYNIASKDKMDFIKSDVKRLCILLFKPYFKNSDWLREACRKYEKESDEYKFEHGIINNEPPEDLYNSLIVYLKDFVINLSI